MTPLISLSLQTSCCSKRLRLATAFNYSLTHLWVRHLCQRENSEQEQILRSTFCFLHLKESFVSIPTIWLGHSYMPQPDWYGNSPPYPPRWRYLCHVLTRETGFIVRQHFSGLVLSCDWSCLQSYYTSSSYQRLRVSLHQTQDGLFNGLSSRRQNLFLPPPGGSFVSGQ